MREADTQFVPWEQRAVANALAVDERTMPRAEVVNVKLAVDDVQPAVVTAEPAVVDPDVGIIAAPQFDRKALDDNLARRCQGILAKELQLHGREGSQGTGKNWREAVKAGDSL